MLTHKQSVRCPTCQTHTSQERGAERGTRYCGSCGNTFTLQESREAERPAVAPLAPKEEEAHPEDFCHKCGRPNIIWFAPNELWNKAVRAAGEPEILCPVCFVQLVEAIGINTVWRVAPRDHGTADSAGAMVDAPSSRREANRLLDAIEQSIHSLSQPLSPTETTTRMKLSAEYGLSYVRALRERLSTDWFSASAPVPRDEAVGWRDIETAPRDSSWILGLMRTGRQVVIRWGGGTWEDDNRLCRDPVRWIPLPPPPVTKP